jgi:hypothetical protein
MLGIPFYRVLILTSILVIDPYKYVLLAKQLIFNKPNNIKHELQSHPK